MNVRVTTSGAVDGSRAALVRRALRLEWLTVAWMVVEAGLALDAGIRAHSVTLSAFGIDSVIELLSASVLLWRLVHELRDGQEFAGRIERIASRLGSALLFLLATYIILRAAWSVWTRQGEQFSLMGLLVACLAMPIMIVLAREKLDVASQLASRSMRTDAIESLTCGWLSLIVVVGLLVNRLFGAWWIDAVTSLGIVGFVVKEAREAWNNESCCGEDHGPAMS